MTLKVEYVEKLPETIEKEAIKNLIKNFNQEAIKQNSKYQIIIRNGDPHIIQKFWFFENYDLRIYFTYNKKFLLDDYADEEILMRDIKPILDNIPEELEATIEKEEK